MSSLALSVNLKSLPTCLLLSCRQLPVSFCEVVTCFVYYSDVVTCLVCYTEVVTCLSVALMSSVACQLLWSSHLLCLLVWCRHLPCLLLWCRHLPCLLLRIRHLPCLFLCQLLRNICSSLYTFWTLRFYLTDRLCLVPFAQLSCSSLFRNYDVAMSRSWRNQTILPKETINVWHCMRDNEVALNEKQPCSGFIIASKTIKGRCIVWDTTTLCCVRNNQVRKDTFCAVWETIKCTVCDTTKLYYVFK